MARGLIVHTGSRLEDLFAELADTIAAHPLDPMVDEVVVVPTQGLGRWLRLRLATRFGVAGSLQLPFLGGFLANLAQQRRTTGDPFAKATLLFRIWRALRDPVAAPQFGPATDYCRDDPDDRKRFQLCQHLARVFDDYQVYRPDVLQRWTAGDDTRELGPHAGWQARLWRRLLADAGFAAPAPGSSGKRAAGALLFPELAEPALARTHAPIRIELLRARLADASAAHAALPPRLSVFGASTLPQAFVDALAAVAAHVPVHLFVPQPAALRDGDSSNRWLDAFGQQSREFAKLLADTDERRAGDLQFAEVEAGDARPPASLLERVQRAIGDLDGGPDVPWPAPARDDDSLRVHDCHSVQRELEVVRDQLLAAFAADATLQPHDVFVLVPDIERYAPIAHAVFGPVFAHLPFHVADRTPATELPICGVVFALLDLAQGRFEAHDVFRVLEEPAVHRRFGLQAADLPVLRARCEQAAIRWGIDGASRARTCRVPAFDDNAWRPGLERLLLGVATGPVDDLVLGVLPTGDATSSRDESLARFATFVELLFTRLEPLARPQRLDAWATLLDELLPVLFAAETPDDQLAVERLTAATSRLRQAAREAGVVDTWTPTVLRDWLEQTLQEASSARGFLAGAVTVAALQPMRTVPARCLFVCGLDDASFPRRPHALPFDLVAAQHRLGDRDARLDDRQLFLDLLLAARNELHFTYVGRSQKDDSDCAPSVLLAELLDLLVHHGGTATRDHVVVRHPLQPWSHRYRSGADERLFTYHRGRLPAVGERVDEAPWFTGEARVPPEFLGDELSLEMLLEFWKHPCRFFLKHVCRMQVRGEDDAEDTTEPFAVDALQRWRIQDQLVKRAGRDAAADARLAFARASGMLPPFGHGDAVFVDLDEEVAAFLRAREAYGPTAARALRVPIEGGTLHGTVAGVTGDHLVVARMASVRMKDKLRGLVLHAAVAVLRSLGEVWPARTVVLGRDGAVELQPLAADAARQALDLFVYGFRQGLRVPLPFFPETSHVYGSRMRKSDDETAARNAARNEWLPKYGSPVPSESEDPAHVLCMRGRDALATPEFAPWALAIGKLLHECTERA